ncbi:CvpA family protein [Neptunomonas japonica]|uniref:Membrane protein required for colicin V production n=1 Tax=Neptunomonas japonica JAMM 1380 TaxID=1441457 RepID=A0A7R6P8Z8_9GAMM|nr:CvpA family protein [Neptunomonas japonica]BBB29434.1 membrane protein required for colicin V production [Neptunomonas japonica JAMM 1380]
MNWADWTILGIVGISGLFSIKRGFVKEALSLLTWVTAFVIARLFTDALATVLSDYIQTPSFRIASAFGILFVLTLIVGALVSNLVSLLVEATGLSGTDRILGMGFGLARGALVVVVLVALLGGTPAVLDAWWKESELIPHFVLMETWSREVASEVGQLIWNAGR